MKKIFGLSFSITAVLFSATASMAAQIKFHPLESYTAVYEQKGTISGISKEYCRKYCFEKVEIEDFLIKMAGMTLPQKSHKITIGEKVFSIDAKTGIVREIRNPFYATIAARMQGRDPAEFAKEALRSIGGVETGETATYNGINCRVWRNQMLGQTMCISKDFITVHIKSNLAGVTIERTLLELRIGDPGPDNVYKIPENAAVLPMPKMPEGAPAGLKALMESLQPKQ